MICAIRRQYYECLCVPCDCGAGVEEPCFIVGFPNSHQEQNIHMSRWRDANVSAAGVFSQLSGSKLNSYKRKRLMRMKRMMIKMGCYD